MNSSSSSPSPFSEDIVYQTETLVKRLLQHPDGDKENVSKELFALVRNVKHLAENCSKEKQHAAAVQLHVEQLEKIIVRLRGGDRDIPVPVGIVGRTTPFPVGESEVDSLRLELEQTQEKISYLSGVVEEKDNLIVQLHDELEKRTVELDTSCQVLLSTQENVTAADEALTSLDAQLKETQQVNETLVQQIQMLESNYAALQEDNAHKIEELQSEIAQKQAAIDTLSTSVASENFIYHDILEQFNAHMTNGLSVFAAHVSESFTSLIHGSERLVRLQQNINLIKQVLTDRDQKISVLTAELQVKEFAAEAASNDAKLARQYLLAKSDEVVEIRQRVDSLTEELSNMAVQKADTELALATKDDELSRTLANLEESQSRAVMLSEGFETIGEQLERYKSLSDKLNEDLSSEQLKNSMHANEVAQLQAKVSELESSLKCFETTSVTHDESVARIADLERTLESKEREIVSMRANFDDEKRRHQEEMSVLQREMDTFQSRISDVDQLLPQLQFQLTEAHRIRVTLMEECEQLQKTLAENESTIQSLNSENAAKLVELDHLRSQCEHWQSKLGVLTQQLVERNSEVDELGGRVQDLEKEVQLARSQMSSSQSDAANQLAFLTQAKLNLEATLGQSNDEVEHLKRLLNDKVTEVETLNQKLNDMSAVIDRLSSDVSRLNNLLGVEAESANAELAQCRGEIDRLSAELKSSSEELERSRQQVEDRKTESDGLKESLDQSHGEVQRLSTELKVSSDEIARLSHLLEMKNESVTAEVSDLIARLSQSYTEIERLSSLVTAGSDEIENLKQLLGQEKDMANDRVGDLTNQLGQCRCEIERLSLELTASSEQIAQLNQQLALRNESATTERDQFHSEIERLSSELKVRSEEFEQLKQLLQQETTQLGQSNGEIERISGQLKSSCDEVARLNQLLGQQEGNARIAIEEFNKKFAESQSEVQRLSDDVSRLNHLLTVEAESAGAEVGQLNKELAQSRSEVERLSSDLKVSSDAIGKVQEDLSRKTDEAAMLKNLLDQNSENSSRELIELGQKLEAESKLNSELSKQKDQIVEERNGLFERCSFYEAELGKLASFISSFMQFADAKFSQIWSRVDSLCQRVVLLQKDAGSLVVAHRFVLAAMRDVKLLIESEYPKLIAEVMTTVEPALAGLEQRISGCQGNFSKLSGKVSQFKQEIEILSTKSDVFDASSQTAAVLIDVSEVEYLQDQHNAETEVLKREIENRDEQLVVFSQELSRIHENEQRLMLEHEQHVQSLQKPEEGDAETQTLESYISREDVQNLQNALAYCEQQLQVANQRILELTEEVQSYRDVAKRAERRFYEADQAAKSLAQDSQNMAAIVGSLREKLKSSEEKLAASEIGRVQVATQLAALQSTYANIPSPEQSAEIAAECDRLRNKVKFMTDQFELAVSRSALLERSLREKEGQCERLARELGLERQRLLSFEQESSPPSSNFPSPSRESSPDNFNSHINVDLNQYLPVPVKRAFDRVRHSQAAVVTLSASQRFKRIVQQSPVGTAMRQLSITARHRVLNRVSPAKLQFFVTVYVCFLHLMTIFYMFTCYGPPKTIMDEPPHLELQKPFDM